MDTQVYLPRNLRQSQLQKKILVHLSKGPEKSITAIAKSLDSSRPSVSRSLHKLEQSGRVRNSMHGYELTIWGREESLEVEILEPVKGIKILWWDTSVGFNCSCGNTEIIIDDESGDKTCDCGQVYRFTAKLETVRANRKEDRGV